MSSFRPLVDITAPARVLVWAFRPTSYKKFGPRKPVRMTVYIGSVGLSVLGLWAVDHFGPVAV